MSNTYVDAIEPWVVDQVQRRYQLDQAMVAQQERVHQAQLHQLQVMQTGQSKVTDRAALQHNTVNSQHIDVDV